MAGMAAYMVRVVDGPGQGLQTTVGTSLDVGRDANGLSISDPRMSRLHCRLRATNDTVMVEDLGSSGGTFVDGKRVTAPTVMACGSIIAAGASRLVVLTYESSEQISSRGGGASIVLTDGRRFEVPITGTLQIGRDVDSNDVVIEDSSVSRRHAELRDGGDGLSLVDLGSSGGTFVNGDRVLGTARLQAEDIVSFSSSATAVRIRTAGSTSAQGEQLRQFSVRWEGSGRWHHVEASAEPNERVGAVIDRMAAYLGDSAADDERVVLYSPESGRYFGRKGSWSQVSMRRGSGVVLARAAADVVEAEPDPVAAPSTPRHRFAVNQLPRSVRLPERQRPVVPSPPDGTSLRGRGLVWQIGAGSAAVLGGVSIVLLRGNSQFRVFGYVFAAVGVVTILGSVLGDQSRRRFRQGSFRQRVASLDVELEQLRQKQLLQLRSALPSIAELRAWPDAPDRRIWERRANDDDVLCLRLGTADAPSLIDFDEGWRRSDSPLAAEIAAVADRHLWLRDAPVVTPGLGAPVIGIWGDPQASLSLARSLLVQAAILHSPRDVGLTVLARDSSWDWCRWLPHLEGRNDPELSRDDPGVEALAEQLAREYEKPPTNAERARLRLIVIPADVATSAHGRKVLSSCLAGQAQVIVVGSRREHVPSEATLEIECDATTARLRGLIVPPHLDAIRLELIDPDAALAAVEGLGHLYDVRHHPSARVESIDLLEMLGIGDLERLDPVALWGRPPDPLLTVPIGQDETGLVASIGLRRDGPHGFIAGTTGSGKSVLLQSFLAALALTHSPERLNLFLVDFKGGATFKESGLAELPHTVGLVTDLEGHKALTARAFTSIRAEIARRKELLDQARVENIVQYERLPPGSVENLPNLLVVIDEFALLVKEQEEARNELDIVATQGRSLGVHLLLAMQSPSRSVLSDDIAKNSNIRICLRVVEPEASMTMLDRPDAVYLPHDQPGRGYMRLGGSKTLTPFRAARLRAPGVRGDAVTVRPFCDDDPMLMQVASTAPIDDAATMRSLCQTIVAAAQQAGLKPQRPLWTPPLPEHLRVEQLSEIDDDRSRLVCRLGLADYPEMQERRTVALDFSSGANCFVLGEFGAGKSSTLSHIVVDLAERRSPQDLHVFCIDAGAGALGDLAQLPHVGAIIGADDTERVLRLLDRLTRLVATRRTEMAEAGQRDWLRYRRGVDGGQPWVVLVIDDYVVLRDQLDQVQMGQPLQTLMALAQSGGSVGVHIVLAAAQRIEVKYSLQNLFGLKVILGLAEYADYDIVGLRGVAAREHHPPPGRALIDGPREAHIPLVDEDRLARAARAWPDVAVEALPVSVRAIPGEVHLDELAVSGGAGPTAVPIGLGGNGELETVVVDEDRFGPHLLVLGDDQSGRSTLLMTWVHAARRADPTARFVVLALRRSPLAALASSEDVTIARDEAEAIAVLEALAGADPGTRVHLVVDDAESLSSRVGTLLEPLLRSAREHSLRTVFAARTSDFVRLYDPWARYLLSLRCGLLLMPTADAAMAMEARLPPPTSPPKQGRGYLVERGRVIPVQIARDD